MTSLPDWLPPLVALADYGGDWERYLAALYDFFRQDFVDDKPLFEGKSLAVKRLPTSQGKEATFWHLISEGRQEEERLPDLRRCERIRWIRRIIETRSRPCSQGLGERTARGDEDLSVAGTGGLPGSVSQAYRLRPAVDSLSGYQATAKAEAAERVPGLSTG
jgi:hypothetical protein